jgi:hypothetical protein
VLLLASPNRLPCKKPEEALRTTRRRARAISPFADPDSIRAVCRQVRERCPEIAPRSDRQFFLMLEAVRNVERRPATDTRRGRPARWPREHLLEVARHLRAVLESETRGRISLQSFIGQHLRALRFPSDVQAALASGEINLQEAAQLARLTPERLGCTPAEARARRAEMLKSHLAVQGSQNRLRLRVKELLGELREAEVKPEGFSEVLARADELLEIDPSDTRHLFWEEMKRLYFAMREIQPEDLDEGVLDDFMAAMDGVSNVLRRIEMRRQQRVQRGRREQEHEQSREQSRRRIVV